jgi:hypothetical protein
MSDIFLHMYERVCPIGIRNCHRQNEGAAGDRKRMYTNQISLETMTYRAIYNVIENTCRSKTPAWTIHNNSESSLSKPKLRNGVLLIVFRDISLLYVILSDLVRILSLTVNQCMSSKGNPSLCHAITAQTTYKYMFSAMQMATAHM